MTCISHLLQPPSSVCGEVISDTVWGGGGREGEGLHAGPGASASCSPIWSLKVPLLWDGSVLVSKGQLVPEAVSRVGPI